MKNTQELKVTRRTIYLINLIMVILITCGYMLYRIIEKHKDYDALVESKHNLPKFYLYDLNGNLTNNDFLNKKTPVCIFYFNTSCEFCQVEAKNIKLNINQFKQAQIVMVSLNSLKEIDEFAVLYGLKKVQGVTFLQDKNFEFHKWFGKSSVPAVFIYNSEHKLIKEYHGEVKIESITKHL